MALGLGEQLVLGSIPRPDLRQLDQMADLSSTYGVRREEPSVEHETGPSAAIAVIALIRAGPNAVHDGGELYHRDCAPHVRP